MHEASVSRLAKEKVYLAVKDDAKQCELSLQWALSFIPPQKSFGCCLCEQASYSDSRWYGTQCLFKSSFRWHMCMSLILQ
jgi:hypothetical protein